MRFIKKCFDRLKILFYTLKDRRDSPLIRHLKREHTQFMFSLHLEDRYEYEALVPRHAHTESFADQIFNKHQYFRFPATKRDLKAYDNRIIITWDSCCTRLSIFPNMET